MNRRVLIVMTMTLLTALSMLAQEYRYEVGPTLGIA